MESRYTDDMPSAGRILGFGIVALALGGFFCWVLFQMAYADESLWRLAKIGMGMGVAILGSVLVYALLYPTRRGRRR
jgi:threonine/homoserine efflux transporter RhtA